MTRRVRRLFALTALLVAPFSTFSAESSAPLALQYDFYIGGLPVARLDLDLSIADTVYAAKSYFENYRPCGDCCSMPAHMPAPRVCAQGMGP